MEHDISYQFTLLPDANWTKDMLREIRLSSENIEPTQLYEGSIAQFVVDSLEIATHKFTTNAIVSLEHRSAVLLIDAVTTRLRENELDTELLDIASIIAHLFTGVLLITKSIDPETYQLGVMIAGEGMKEHTWQLDLEFVPNPRIIQG